MENLVKINETVINSKETIKREKETIEFNIKAVLKDTLVLVNNLKGENNLISKKDAIKVIKERYNNITDIDKDLKAIMLSVCNYVYLGINIKLDLVTNNQFKKLVGYFNKLNELPLTKNNEPNARYIKGLENIVNKKKLNNCITGEMYKEYLKEIEEYIEKVKNENK